MKHCIIFSTADSQPEADKIADALLKARAAESVQTSITEFIISLKGETGYATQILLTIKAEEELSLAVARIIKTNHSSSEMPQITKIPATPENLDYIRTNCGAIYERRSRSRT